ncbi:MAG: S26 family signal peptidase [Prevotellaceae bacterium]|nr:S26 family signal peptidase [Prevotellaceae bacterium]
MKNATRGQWIRFAVYTLLYLLFLLWVKSWLGLIVVPFIFDAYITRIIPWGFWKKSENKTVRSIMSWVDAIVFALVAVYFVHNFFCQNYQIPSSSLEKSLLVGDFLYVSKVSYGPRIPNTPLSMPLAQHTLPLIDTKSYIEWPQWKYRRVPGLGQVKRNDIVVFNFPAGDTVALKNQAEDFYSMAYAAGQSVYSKSIRMDTLSLEKQRIVYDLYYAAGSRMIRQNPQRYGKVVTRPVDRRENYVKRCIGMPGDTLQIIDRIVYIDGKPLPEPEHVQYYYDVKGTGKTIPQEFLRDELGLSMEDLAGYTPGAEQFFLPLTQEARGKLLGRKDLVISATPTSSFPRHDMYPKNLYNDWTTDNYGPIWIPRKGATTPLTLANLPFYERCITAYEGNKLEVRGEEIYINGQKADSYTFGMDYYFMMGDNRHNSADSRYWGYVPEDHVVGKPIMVWLSLDKDRGWFSGKIRWNRLFRWVH